MLRFFSTTLGQILAIIATSSAITFLLFATMIYLRNAPPKPPWPWSGAYPIVGLVNMLNQTPGSEQDRLASLALPDMKARLTEAPSPCETFSIDSRDLETVLRHELRDGRVTARACAGAVDEVQALIPIGERTLEVRTDRIERRPPRIRFPLMAALLFMCIGVAGMSAWAVWRVIRPLRRLSERADAFGRDISVTPIAEEGPLEIRRAARAFNRMQQRVARSIDDRTRALAAISHDLRTPLTRMRLQLETGDPATARAKLLKDVDLMQAMTASALAYLSGAFEREEKELVDLGALLSTLADEYEERGAAVSYEGPEHIRVFCRPNALTRALANLIENAIHYGASALITAAAGARDVTIEVADDGPGIPENRRKEVIEPFVRLDPSRSDRPGSVGLGLSIVKEIAEGHGGTLTLSERAPHGLVARLTLPRDPRRG